MASSYSVSSDSSVGNVMLAFVAPAVVPPVAGAFYIFQYLHDTLQQNMLVAGIATVAYLAAMLWVVFTMVRLLPQAIMAALGALYFGAVYYVAVHYVAGLDVTLALAVGLFALLPGCWFGWTAARDVKLS
jgi:uncharacterized membrane protein YjjP (DUF1212 family)